MKFRRLLIIIPAWLFVTTLFAGNDEGMWLPLYIKQLNEQKMQQMGMKLTADDIYSINHASIKDAILRLGSGFCTGELVSDSGLIFTNHHCGYDAIAELSSVKDNYLENGYWAATRDKEIPVPGLTVSRLVSMRNVTDFILDATKNMDEGFMKTLKIGMISDSLVKTAIFDTEYEAEVKSYFSDNEYYLLVYETFRDVRFVGAPPSSVGKFGGDTDNWMWPRHTGDFSILRVYTGPDGKPADYNTENIPYKPLRYLTISLRGINENDFAMILGYPAQTDRYLTSYDLEFKINQEQPAVIDIFGETLRLMKMEMDNDPLVKLSFASDFASLNNTYKYYVGQQLGLKKYGLLGKYKIQEIEYTAWVNGDAARKEKYGSLLSDLERAYKRYQTITPGFMFLGYGLFRLNLVNQIFTFTELQEELGNIKSEPEVQLKMFEMKMVTDKLFEKKYFPTEKKLLKAMLVMYYNKLDPSDEYPFFKEILSKYKGKSPEEKIGKYIEYVYNNTVLFEKEKLDKFYKKPSAKILSKDPAIKMLGGLLDIYRNSYDMTYRSVNSTIDQIHGKYIGSLREWNPNKVQYPDANSTMRMTYGKVTPYFPRDGVNFDYRTTYLGILQKENPKDEEFVVPTKLHDLLIKKDFGRYAKNDTLYTCFLTDNDISGGNSGSPVLNGDGQLIGLAFDGNWEAMTGDITVNPKYNRTINVDIRYVLFILDKFMGAKRLINELNIVE